MKERPKCLCILGVGCLVLNLVSLAFLDRKQSHCVAQFQGIPFVFQSVNSNHQRRLSKLKMVNILSLAGHI